MYRGLDYRSKATLFGLPWLHVTSSLGMEETAVRVAVHRLRRRYRQLLREEIANTLANPAQVREEFRALLGASDG